MEYMKKMKWFNLADYLEEEAYLQEQHKKGWKMTALKAPFSIYTFEKCIPEDYVYQLDFKQEEQDAGEYIQLFEDCGWEHFYKFGNWYYFRKKKSKIDDENVIFNDAASRAEMAKKVIKFQGGVLSAIFFPVIMGISLLVSTELKNSPFFSAVLIVYFIIVAISAYVHIKNLWKLNKIIMKEKQA